MSQLRKVRMEEGRLTLMLVGEEATRFRDSLSEAFRTYGCQRYLAIIVEVDRSEERFEFVLRDLLTPDMDQYKATARAALEALEARGGEGMSFARAFGGDAIRDPEGDKGPAESFLHGLVNVLLEAEVTNFTVGEMATGLGYEVTLTPIEGETGPWHQMAGVQSNLRREIGSGAPPSRIAELLREWIDG